MIDQYKIADIGPVDIDKVGTSKIGDMTVNVIDLVADYAELMESLFDFDAIRAMFYSGFRMAFDAMHAVTGPYAKEILRTASARPTTRPATLSRCRISAVTIPTPTSSTPALGDEMMREDAPDFGGGLDGDGDRNLIIGKGIFVTPSDSLALLAANAHLAPGYKAGLKGIARSMPTSEAADRVAKKLGIGMYETPTGWKFFGVCTTPVWRRSVARKAPAPAPTMCARRMGCGLCCSGLTSLRRPQGAREKDRRGALGRIRPQLLFPPRL